MKLQLSTALLAVILIFGVLFPLEEKSGSMRSPAAVGDDTCFSLVKGFFSNKPSRVSNLFSTLPGIKKNTPFDFEKFTSLRSNYVTRISSEGSEGIEIDRTPEGLLAFAEALNHKNHLELGPGLQQLSKRKMNSIQNISKKVLDKKPLSVDDLEHSISEIYSLILGPTFKLKDAVGEAGKRRILFRLFAEDLTTKGLLVTLKKYKTFKDPSKYQRLLKFFETKKGKSMLTGLFNLPVIWGMPPFYLPGLKKIRIPDSLAKEAVLKGMDDEMVTKMIKSINEDLVASKTFKLETQAKYVVFRRYYMYGVAAFTVYFMYSDFRLAEQYREENRIYEEALEDVSETMNSLEVLEERGFDLFEDEPSESGTLSNSFCRAIEDCLDSEKDENGQRPVIGSDSFKACKEFMDPDNKCEQY